MLWALPAFPQAQVQFWGLTSAGGNGGGAMISIKADGSDFQSFHFPIHAGAYPGYGQLLEASNGRLYGMTKGGGTDGAGVLFEYDPAGEGSYTVRHHFNAAGGSTPCGSLIEWGGKLYGMTSLGGLYGAGVLFEYDPAGNGRYTVKHHFNGAGGSSPHGSLMEWGARFYGMTAGGGNSDKGVLFEYDPAAEDGYTLKHHFNSAGGSSPRGSLMEWGARFYGMTYEGGNSDSGVLFEYDPSGSGTYTVKHHFHDTEGCNPYGSIIEQNGRFYGMTTRGGNSGFGVIFEYDPADGGSYAARQHFTGAAGCYPPGSLTGAGDKLYGMTSMGGIHGAGVLFEYDLAGGGIYRLKHHFNGAAGSSPCGSLMEHDGKFYGMTSWGGTSDKGVLFEYDPAGGGSYSVKVDFNGADSGSLPYGSLIERSGKLYGMTTRGGSSDDGVLFEYDPAGGGSYTAKHHFNGADGRSPCGSLIERDGKFYGMTAGGGSNGKGVLFEYDPAAEGRYRLKHHFNGAEGRNPCGDLMEWGGKFYGMTAGGGNSDFGVIFEYDPAGGGSYVVKHHFFYVNGSYPTGSLIESGGKFYGMTSEGGNRDCGVLFEYDPAGGWGSYVVKHHFNSANGSYPRGSLIECNGAFYGMTTRGGSNDKGVLFEYDPAGPRSYTVKHHFSDAEGCSPNGSLMEWDGKFYGMTAGGGNSDHGVIFVYDPAGGGSYAVLKHFEGPDGANPIYGHLIAVDENITSASSLRMGNSFALYPNPTTGELNLELSAYLGKGVRIEVYSSAGKLVQFTELDEVQNLLESLDLEGLQSGMYLVKVRSTGLPDVPKRVVLQRE